MPEINCSKTFQSFFKENELWTRAGICGQTQMLVQKLLKPEGVRRAPKEGFNKIDKYVV